MDIVVKCVVVKCGTVVHRTIILNKQVEKHKSDRNMLSSMYMASMDYSMPKHSSSTNQKILLKVRLTEVYM